MDAGEGVVVAGEEVALDLVAFVELEMFRVDGLFGEFGCLLSGMLLEIYSECYTDHRGEWDSIRRNMLNRLRMSQNHLKLFRHLWCKCRQLMAE